MGLRHEAVKLSYIAACLLVSTLCGKASGCPTWNVSSGMNSPGLSQLGVAGQYTEDTCKAECVKNSTCLNIDYNHLDTTCFLGSTANPRKLSNPPVNHWDLTRCSDADNSSSSTNTTQSPSNSSNATAPSCMQSWTEYNGFNSLNGVLIPQIKDLYLCMRACVFVPVCVGIDVDLTSMPSIGCWFHYNETDFTEVYTTQQRTQFRLDRCPEETYLCEPTFNVTANTFSTGGTLLASVSALNMCQFACQELGPTCRGIDFYDSQCYTHTAATLGKNVQTRAGANQYLMTFVCGNTCTPRWTRLKNVAGSGATPIPVRTGNSNLTGCLEVCLRSRSCAGIEYTKGAALPCALYNSSQQAAMMQTQPKAGTIQYQLTDPCYQKCQSIFTLKDGRRYMLREPAVVPATTLAECDFMCRITSTCAVYQVTKAAPFVCTLSPDYIPYTDVVDSNIASYIWETSGCTSVPAAPPPTPAGGPVSPGPSPAANSTGSSLGNTTGSSLGNTTGGSGGNITGSCTPVWVKYTGMNTLGLQQKGGINEFTEESCKDACFANSTCKCIDYNNQDKTCWHGTVANLTRLVVEPINHWELTRNCPNGCGVEWTLSAGMNTPGLMQLGSANQYTEDTCKTYCEGDQTCKNIDYNRQDLTCFFGTSANPPKRPNGPVNHWDIMRRTNC